MATLKRQNADGTWSYIQMAGQDIMGHMNDDHRHAVSVRKVKKTKDSQGIFTVVDHLRKSDNLLLFRSTLSGGTSPQYNTRTLQYFNAAGAVIKTETYTLAYDSDGDLVSEV